MLMPAELEVDAVLCQVARLTFAIVVATAATAIATGGAIAAAGQLTTH